MKKHIIISPREGSDFSMDLIFAGLVRRFGKENVIDWPPRAKHREGKPELIGHDEQDYGAERRSLCYVEGCGDMKEWSRSEIITEIFSHNVDAVFLDETNESAVYWHELFALYSGVVRTVVIAGHDSFRGLPRGVLASFGPNTTMFVDDWKSEYDELENTYLTNLSCNFDHLWDVENRDKYLADKKYDICFIGYNSNPARKVVIDHVKKKWGHLNNCIVFEERPDMYDAFVRHDEMFRLIAQSKICLNLPGASTNGRALRYYEIPYVGSLMVSMRTLATDLAMAPAMGFCFESLEELDKLIQQRLDDNGYCEDVACLDHYGCMESHTIDARMNYIFEVLNNG